jgi:hypothetical protein
MPIQPTADVIRRAASVTTLVAATAVLTVDVSPPTPDVSREAAERLLAQSPIGHQIRDAVVGAAEGRTDGGAIRLRELFRDLFEDRELLRTFAGLFDTAHNPYIADATEKTHLFPYLLVLGHRDIFGKLQLATIRRIEEIARFGAELG